MTRPHVTEHEVADYAQRRLSPPDLIRITDHAAACEDCRRRLARGDIAADVVDLRRGLFEGAASEATAHVVDDELAGYVDGTLDPIDAEIVASHLEECAACTADVRDLQSFRAGSQSTRRRALTFVGLAAAAAVLTWIVLPRLLPTDAPPDRNTTAMQVALNDSSGPLTRDAHGQWSGWPAQSPALDERIRRALGSQKVEIPVETLELPGHRASLRGTSTDTPPSFLLSPVGIVVEEDRPVFRWRPVARASGYVVTLSTADGGGLIKSPRVSTTDWTPAHPLKRGKSYLWQVTALTPSESITAPQPPEPEARFLVLDALTLERIEETRRRTSRSHLVLGILYAEAGLLDDAERELTALATLNPGVALPKGLLADLREQRSQKAAPTTENAAQ